MLSTDFIMAMSNTKRSIKKPYTSLNPRLCHKDQNITCKRGAVHTSREGREEKRWLAHRVEHLVTRARSCARTSPASEGDFISSVFLRLRGEVAAQHLLLQTMGDLRGERKKGLTQRRKEEKGWTTKNTKSVEPFLGREAPMR